MVQRNPAAPRDWVRQPPPDSETDTSEKVFKSGSRRQVCAARSPGVGGRGWGGGRGRGARNSGAAARAPFPPLPHFPQTGNLPPSRQQANERSCPPNPVYRDAVRCAHIAPCSVLRAMCGHTTQAARSLRRTKAIFCYSANL